MSGPNLANSVNNLNGTDENNEHGKVNESKDGSGREEVKKEPGELGKKVMPSRSKNHDSVKSVEESTSPLGTSKEHEKNAADNGEKCSLTINKEPTPVTGNWIECSDGTDKKCVFNDSQSLFTSEKCESGESSKDSDANPVKSDMPGLMEVISFDNLYATGENNENGNVNESKES